MHNKENPVARQRDSYNAAEQAAFQKLELDRKWKDLSDSTDYASGDIDARFRD